MISNSLSLSLPLYPLLVSPNKMKFNPISIHLLFLIYTQAILLFPMNCLWLQANASGNETDMYALLKFKESISSDPNGALSSWNGTLHFCRWFGITCGRQHQRVTSLVLEGQNLAGSISPYVGNLSFLRILDLQNNSLHGDIPKQVGNLFRLQQLMLNNNTLVGEIPVNISHCSRLETLRLSWNNLIGRIPSELGLLTKLHMFALSANELTGEIPASIGNLTSVTLFSLGANNLEGNVPNELVQLKSLVGFSLASNNLSGIFPSFFFNISSLNILSVTDNQLSGTLPSNIGLTLPNIQLFEIGRNQFSGTVPASLCNASQLQILDIFQDNFVGKVPTQLGNLKNLRILIVARNRLGSNSENDLDFLNSLPNCTKLQLLYFSYNNFGGTLPSSIANLSTQLTNLFLEYNQIGGIIPSALENLSSLTVISMGNNLFTGAIPSSLQKLKNLQSLQLGGNRLSGTFPSFIGNISLLYFLDLSNNTLEGSIPPSIENCRNLQYLDVSNNNLSGIIPPELVGLSSLSVLLNLSWNSLTGVLPMEIGKLNHIQAIDISENNLSGEIPDSLGDCSSLEYLYMQDNSFQGIIPSSLASLRGLQRLDLSRNNLTGGVPQDLQSLQFLSYLNLSFNDLEGEVPKQGVFKNASAVSLAGNGKLCGGIQQLHLPKCTTKVMKKGMSPAVKLTIISTCALLFVALMLAILLFYWTRKSRENSWKSPEFSPVYDNAVKVSYKEIYEATEGFSSSNLIGCGSFGKVYKGALNQVGRIVAVKVFNLEQMGATKSFMAECKALRNIRHRNLVKIIAACSSMDYKSNEFKALIFEFMPNGSLEKWLYPDKNEARKLNLLQVLNIAIDVASALHYIHDLCETPIIHCDLKPSNILLDEYMVAHVGDFGLARLFPLINAISQSQMSTIGMKGTVGYAAPEYGMGGAASKAGDVYGYGILALEMLSGKSPTDEMFKDGLNLHDFVKAELPEGLLQIVDPTLLQTEIEDTESSRETAEVYDEDKIEQEERETEKDLNLSLIRANVHRCLVSTLEIALLCSAESPKARPNMEMVIKRLQLIKNAFLGMGSREADHGADH